jgi:hypothetical protein
MNILITTLSWLICLAFIVGCYFFWEHVGSILDFGEYLFMWLIVVCSLIWFGRRNKDGIYRIFKDIHQSNLDDIEQQQLEEPVDEVIVKEQISNSVAAFWFFLFLVICCVSFLMSQESIGVIDWLIALSIIAAPLILAFFVGEWLVDKDDIKIQEFEEQETKVI